jgi:hypothetical protein
MGTLVKSQTLQLVVSISRIVFFGTKHRIFPYSGQTFEAEEKSVRYHPGCEVFIRL